MQPSFCETLLASHCETGRQSSAAITQREEDKSLSQSSINSYWDITPQALH